MNVNNDADQQRQGNAVTRSSYDDERLMTALNNDNERDR